MLNLLTIVVFIVLLSNLLLKWFMASTQLHPIPITERICTDGAKKAEWVRAMHMKVREQI